MRQLISVRAIIQSGDKTLFLKRANGRRSILGKYELPGGKLGYGEQPEDALERYLGNDTGLTIETAKLFDVLTYIDHDDRDTQYTFILYQVTVRNRPSDVTLSRNYSAHLWEKPHDVDQKMLTESSKLLLGISAQHSTKASGDVLVAGEGADTAGLDYVIVYSDGGSRGNPGPSASGFVVMNKREEVLHQGGAYLGIATNNQAEYHGVRLGLEKALEMGVRSVDFRMDSLLVVNQLNGIYKIKNQDLWPIYEKIKELAGKFDRVQFSHVRREFNQLADGMVNKILDAHASETV